MNDFLDESFLDELFKLCIKNKDVFLTVQRHLEERFLPEKSGHREVFKKMKKGYKIDSVVPSIGILKEQLKKDEHALECLGDIRMVQDLDVKPLVDTLNNFIKQNKFVASFSEVVDLYNKSQATTVVSPAQTAAAPELDVCD